MLASADISVAAILNTVPLGWPEIQSCVTLMVLIGTPDLEVMVITPLALARLLELVQLTTTSPFSTENGMWVVLPIKRPAPKL